MRYYVANADLIPFHAQPSEGYTKLQAIARAQREVDEMVNLFGGKASDYAKWFHILDSDLKYCEELDSAI